MNQLEALKSLLREACDHLQEERDEVFTSFQIGGTIKVSDQFSAAAAERVASIDDLIKRAGIAINAVPDPDWKAEDLVVGKIYTAGEMYDFTHLKFVGLDHSDGDSTLKFERIPPQSGVHQDYSYAAIGGGRGEPLNRLLAPREDLRIDTAASADKARLDFLDECNRRLNAHHQTSYGWEMVMNHNVNRLMTGRHLDVDLNDAKARGHKSCRDAIDAEMQRVERARAAATETER